MSSFSVSGRITSTHFVVGTNDAVRPTEAQPGHHQEPALGTDKQEPDEYDRHQQRRFVDDEDRKQDCLPSAQTTRKRRRNRQAERKHVGRNSCQQADVEVDASNEDGKANAMEADRYCGQGRTGNDRAGRRERRPEVHPDHPTGHPEHTPKNRRRNREEQGHPQNGDSRRPTKRRRGDEPDRHADQCQREAVDRPDERGDPARHTASGEAEHDRSCVRDTEWDVLRRLGRMEDPTALGCGRRDCVERYHRLTNDELADDQSDDGDQQPSEAWDLLSPELAPTVRYFQPDVHRTDSAQQSNEEPATGQRASRSTNVQGKARPRSTISNRLPTSTSNLRFVQW